MYNFLSFQVEGMCTIVLESPRSV